MMTPASQFWKPILTVTICVLSGLGVFVGFTIQAAIKQRQAVEMVMNRNGSVTYDYMLSPTGEMASNPVPAGPSFLRNFFGIDCFNTVVRINLDSTEVSDSDLKALRGTPHLKWLNLFGTTVSDQGALNISSLTELERLELGGNSRITDVGLGYLSGMTSLKSLYVDGPQITTHGLDDIRKKLPQLQP